MRTDREAVDESVEIEEETVQDPRESGVELHDAPDEPSLTDDARREAIRAHLRFKQAGRRRTDGLRAPSGHVPVSMFPYLDVQRLRGDYPVCIFDDIGTGIMPLARVFDQAIDGVDLEGDELERCKRWALQLEARLRARATDHPDDALFKLWNACSEDLSNHYRDDLEKQRRLHDDLAALRGQMPSDAVLVNCDRRTAPTLIAAIVRSMVTRKRRESEEAIQEVVKKLSDLLTLEFEESDTGLAPEHLKETVGQAFEEDLDFDALSSLLHEAPHGESLTASRRKRIETILETLNARLHSLRNESPELESVSSSDELIDHVRTRIAGESIVARAWVAAQLEATGRFDEERHRDLLVDDGAELWGQAVASPVPLEPIHLDINGPISRADVSNLVELFDRQVPVRVLVSVGAAVDGGTSDSSEPYLPASLGERLLSVAQPTGFLCQRTLADAEGLLEAMSSFLDSDRTAVMIVYDGAAGTDETVHPYLRSAACSDSRVAPTFLTDAESGPSWQRRFSVAGNEQPERVWPEVALETGQDGSTRRSVFDAAAFMLLHPEFEDHFAILERAEWHDSLVPLDKYSGHPQHIPFIEAASPDGVIKRVIVTDYVWTQTMRVAQRWMSLRELGGIANSFAEKAVADAQQKLAAEHRERIDELESEHRSVLAATTGKLASEIVANIAAGLLDAGSIAAAPARPKTQPAPAEIAPSAPEEPETPQPAPDKVAAEEEDDLEILDEAYIETPRCTTCDECTTLNPRLFAYNDNKQAYIADISAGTYRELVLAAEKCPVRIIHPGKPLNPDEPHLDELLKRAEPFR